MICHDVHKKGAVFVSRVAVLKIMVLMGSERLFVADQPTKHDTKVGITSCVIPWGS